MANIKRRVTARDIAQYLGISIMTVSRALRNQSNVREKTRRRVLRAATKFGYNPDRIAKSLVMKKTYTIGIVVPEITHSFFPEVIRGVEEVAYHSGYHLILTHSGEDAERERDALRTLESNRVDGVLISTVQTVVDFSLYRQMIESGMPLVFYDRIVRGIGASCVTVDDKESEYYITQHLVGHGYKEIAHLGGPPKISIGRSRLEGFKKALEDNGLTVDPDLIVVSGFHETGGYEAMRKLLNRPKSKQPRAVVAVNDPAAFGAICAILDVGLRIPEDIAIVGFSDDVRASLMPSPLTTVRQPAYEIGKRAMTELISQIEEKSTRRQMIAIKTEQVLRRSCGCNGNVVPPEG
jgi:DNA-binding LacI/PurR family transcriptional regulator